jgi:hypothetical protein
VVEPIGDFDLLESLRIQPLILCWHPPNSGISPSLDGIEQSTMVVCKLVSTIRPQKL